MPDTGSRRQWVLAMLKEDEAPLVRYAQRLLSDPDAAREAVQHAFVRFCEQAPAGLAGREAAWLYRVCRNKALDLIRARQKVGVPTDDELASYPGREPDPAAWAEQRDTCGELRRRMADLPDGQRESLGLWCDGLSNRQIAEVTGTSEGNVRVMLHRALKRLRSVMTAGEPGT